MDVVKPLMWGSVLQCCSLATAYVLPIHYGCKSRCRNDQVTIRYRMMASFAVCAIAWVPLWLDLKHSDSDTGLTRHQLLDCLGLRTNGLLSALFLPLGLTASLFLGPLAMRAIDWRLSSHDGQAAEHFPRHRPRRSSWAMAARDLLAAPLTEEFVFRACMAPLLLHRGFAVKTVIAVTPLFFGIAHLHHLYELLIFQKFTFSRAIQQVAAQMLYTTIFGAYATWLLIRTGNLGAPISAHFLCNVLGFPDFDAMAEHRYQPMLSAATGVGVLLFGLLCKPATSPSLFGGPLAVPNAIIW